MDLTVLVTRPAHQNEQLIKRLDQAGHHAISFPTIAINAATPTPFLKGLSKNIYQFDVALFVSRNAVDYAFQYLDASGLPDTLQLGVIGKGTWQALKNKGVESHIIPAESYNSEGLLASDSLQSVNAKRIAIFRGQEGRNLLGDTLQKRGARVDYIEVYRREKPQYGKDHYAQLISHHRIDLAIFTSAEGLINCFSLLNEKQAQELRTIPWLLISERMRETARNLRHNAAIIIADSASDEGLLSAIQAWQPKKV